MSFSFSLSLLFFLFFFLKSNHSSPALKSTKKMDRGKRRNLRRRLARFIDRMWCCVLFQLYDAAISHIPHGKEYVKNIQCWQRSCIELLAGKLATGTARYCNQICVRKKRKMFSINTFMLVSYCDIWINQVFLNILLRAFSMKKKILVWAREKNRP